MAEEQKSNTDDTRLEWLEELNEQQRKAVEHGDGPLLVVAGAGSGKTKTLAYRVAYLIATGTDPARILLLTFTRRSAQEMLRRAALITQKGTALTTRIWGGTFHSTANRLLRIYAKTAGLSPDFTVMDESDAADTLNVIRHDMGLSAKDKRFPRKTTCRSIYSRRVNGTETLAEILARFYPWCAKWEPELKNLFKTYVQIKQERCVLDYDDLLLYWEQILHDDEVAKDVEDRFDHILVDEYQDTNPVQARILAGMRKTNKNIMVVGDDAQSIYSFRAATVRNMLDFPNEMPGTTVLTLEQNYRSVMPILETTNLVIAPSPERYTKDLWSARQQGERPKLVTCWDEHTQDQFVVKKVLEHYEQGIPLHKQAVLFRTGHLSDSLEIELTRHNIQYHKYGGLRFLEASHVKDLISFLRIVENPRDEIAWFRTLQLLDGIGPTGASRVIGHVKDHQHDPRAIGDYSAPPAARDGLSLLAGLINDLVDAGKRHPASQVERIREFYDPILEKTYENPTVRKKDIENLEQIATGYESRRKFLTDLTLDPPTSTSDLAGPPLQDEDWLVLSTIHSAKGCEWDVVFVIHAADGCLPSDMSTGKPDEIEEERRLTYVAMTRARDFLYVAWPMKYYHKWYKYTDRHSYAQVCRFLTDNVLETFDQIDLSYPGDQDDASRFAFRDDVPTRLRSMWDD